jgi:hypothetical protein
VLPIQGCALPETQQASCPATALLPYLTQQNSFQLIHHWNHSDLPLLHVATTLYLTWTALRLVVLPTQQAVLQALCCHSICSKASMVS